MINRTKPCGIVVNGVLPFAMVILLTLGTCGVRSLAADYTLRVIGRASQPQEAFPEQSTEMDRESSKASQPLVFARVQDHEKPHVPLAPTAVPTLKHVSPNRQKPLAQPDLRVQHVSQPDTEAVVVKQAAHRQCGEPSHMLGEAMAAPLDVIAGQTQERDAVGGGLPTEDCQCPFCTTQSGARTICGVDCSKCRAPFDATWKDTRPIPWSVFGQGEYIGPPRTEHVFQYFLRVNDQLEIVYFLSRDKTSQPYRLGVGDKLRIESVANEKIDREVDIQPDGFVALPQVGEVQAAGKTVSELRDAVEQLYATVQRIPQITVTPITVNAALQDIVDSVDRRSGTGGQNQPVRVTPEGTLQLPGLGSIFVQGLTLDELKRELEARYRARYGPGLDITPLLAQRAPTYVFVGGEVASPGRYTLEGPTTVMQAIALAGGWNVGGNTNQVVVFRRDENWCLKATRLDLFHPLYGKAPCPVNDVWLRDNDLVIVPKRPILVADDIIDLYFTRGAYAVFPVQFLHNFSRGSTLLPTP